MWLCNEYYLRQWSIILWILNVSQKRLFTSSKSRHPVKFWALRCGKAEMKACEPLAVAKTFLSVGKGNWLRQGHLQGSFIFKWTPSGVYELFMKGQCQVWVRRLFYPKIIKFNKRLQMRKLRFLGVFLTVIYAFIFFCYRYTVTSGYSINKKIKGQRQWSWLCQTCLLKIVFAKALCVVVKLKSKGQQRSKFGVVCK